jgi:hypothetical protein
MKRIVFLGIMPFLFSPHLFAEEFSIDLKNIFFTWQLYGYKIENQEIDFIDLNPLFFGKNNNNSLLSDFMDKEKEYNNNKSRQELNTNSQETRFSLLATSIFYTGLIFGSIYMYSHPHEGNIYDDAWKQQNEMKILYQRIYGNNRNY